MHLPSTLVIVVAVALFASGHAVTDLSQTKFSQSLGKLHPEVRRDPGDGNRLLRSATTATEDTDEERALWTELKARFPGTIENVMKNTKKERERIKEQALVFAEFLKQEELPYNVVVFYMRQGYSNSKAFKMGLRYETYKENPWLYHQ